MFSVFGVFAAAGDSTQSSGTSEPFKLGGAAASRSCVKGGRMDMWEMLNQNWKQAGSCLPAWWWELMKVRARKPFCQTCQLKYPLQVYV